MIAAAVELPPISDADFERLRRLVRRGSGIVVPDAKQALLVARLGRRLRSLGLRSFSEYVAHVDQDPHETQTLIEHMCTHETRFFREPRHFELLEERVFPAWRDAAKLGRRPRRARAWSAACSTGEEPYSLAMTMLANLPGFDVEVMATDISTRVLETGRAGVYPVEKATEIRKSYLRAYMLQGTGPREGQMRAGPLLRRTVQFTQQNLQARTYAIGASFDLVFCRNVLIYFDDPTKNAVVTRLLEHLSPSGLLFVGHAESMTASGLPLRIVSPTVYTRAR